VANRLELLPVSIARPVFIAVCTVMGLSCAGIDTSPDSGIRTDSSAIVLDDARKSPGQVPCQVPGPMYLVPRPADVLVLLDRSGSMATAFGSGSRYQAVAALLSDLALAYQKHVRFGYLEMPGRSGCDFQMPGCCASPPVVELALDNAQAMTSAIAQAAPVGGNTPTAAALAAAQSYFDTLDDGVRNRYVLMATDGVPSCTLSGAFSSGNSSTSPGCADALAEVGALGDSGVKVIVLSVGLDSAANPGETSCLDALAQAGGAAIPQASPGYYSAEDPDQLQRAIERIFGEVSRPSCLLEMPRINMDSVVGVYLDGYEIPNDTENGWTWDNSSSSLGIRITGAYCDQIQQFQVSSFEVRYYSCDAPPPP